MNIQNSLENIEKSASEAGLSIPELFAEAKVALSNWSRWQNKKTSPNFSSLAKLERVIQNKLSKVKKTRSS